LIDRIGIAVGKNVKMKILIIKIEVFDEHLIDLFTGRLSRRVSGPSKTAEAPEQKKNDQNA
jgi:hypothetical protein